MIWVVVVFVAIVVCALVLILCGGLEFEAGMTKTTNRILDSENRQHLLEDRNKLFEENLRLRQILHDLGQELDQIVLDYQGQIHETNQPAPEMNGILLAYEKEMDQFDLAQKMIDDIRNGAPVREKARELRQMAHDFVGEKKPGRPLSKSERDVQFLIKRS